MIIETSFTNNNELKLVKYNIPKEVIDAAIDSDEELKKMKNDDPEAFEIEMQGYFLKRITAKPTSYSVYEVPLDEDDNVLKFKN